MASTIFRGHFYTATQLSPAHLNPGSVICVSAMFAFKHYTANFVETEDARRWLGDHGLPRGKAKRLLADLAESLQPDEITGDKVSGNAG